MSTETIEEPKTAVRCTGLLADGWINIYNGGAERGWGVWPTCQAAIDAMRVYGITKQYYATIPEREWCESANH